MTDVRGRRPSQQDVADRAGVSRTTVSFVMNNVAHANIPEETRQRVWRAVDELGFRPNELARSLRSTVSNVIGLVTTEIATTPYAVGIIKGAQQVAFAHGKTLLIVDTEPTDSALEDAMAKLSRWQVEGVIYATEYHREVGPVDWIGETPAVLVDCFTADGSITSVVPDERQGGRRATETLIAAGHRRIGMINGPEGLPASVGRLDGFRDAHESAELTVDERLVRTGDWWQESGARHAADLLDLADPPTALFCANDWMAMGAYDVIKERGLRIPDDVAVIGFDNREEIAAHMRPRLTTIALPYYEMGHWAVEHLLDEEHGYETEHRLLDCPLVRRDSV